MSDEALRALRREAEAHRDGATWLRLGTLLAREGRFDEASAAVLEAEECGSDGGEVLESFAPSSFTIRSLDAGPSRPGAHPKLAWSPDGGELYVAEHAPDGTAGIVAWNLEPGLARPRARAIALNLPARHVLGLVVDRTGRVLLSFRDRGEPTIAFVERGFLQPPFVTDHPVFEAALAHGHVFTSDRETVRAFAPGTKKLAWEVAARQVALDPTGTVATFDGARVELRDPLARAPRRSYPIADTQARLHVARRRALVRTPDRAILLAGDEAIERALPPGRRPDDVILAPSGRHVASLAFGPGTVTIVDLRTGAEDGKFSVGAAVGTTAAWSPSGRTLAVARMTGELILLEGS